MKAAFAWALMGASALVPGCTYGPEQQRATIEQIVPLDGTYHALVAILYERFQAPTGLSAFPDGGRSKVLERSAVLYVLDVADRSSAPLTVQTAPDGLWESFDVHVAGLVGDSVAYVRMVGCPRNGECHARLQSTLTLRVTTAGDVRPVAEVPHDATLPGMMLARRPGEDRYVRFSTDGNVVTARLIEDGPFEPVFEVHEDGSMTAIRG